MEALRRYVMQQLASCMRTTRGYRCWPRARARPRQGVTVDLRSRRPTSGGYGCSGSMVCVFARSRRGTPPATSGCRTFQGALQADRLRRFQSAIKMIGFRRWRAGRTFAASSMTSNRPTLRLWLEKLWNESQLCMRSRTISVGGHPTNENKFAKHELVPLTFRSLHDWLEVSLRRNFPASRIRRRRFAMR